MTTRSCICEALSDLCSARGASGCATHIKARTLRYSTVLYGTLRYATVRYGTLAYSLTECEPRRTPRRRAVRRSAGLRRSTPAHPTLPSSRRVRSAVAERKPEQHARLAFERVAAEVDARLAASVSGFFLENFSIADVVFIPYVERMCASLFYYKGFCVRARWPHIARWLQALEMRETYLGTRSDYHTHAHSLPPQMGGCFHNGTAEQQACRAQVDSGPWEAVPDTTTPAPPSARMEALARVVRHSQAVLRVNPEENAALKDVVLRAALTHLATGELTEAPRGSARVLRYIRDRISVPRDMSLYAARHMRASLEIVAASSTPEPGATVPFADVPIKHRKDQDPRPFNYSS